MAKRKPGRPKGSKNKAKKKTAGRAKKATTRKKIDGRTKQGRKLAAAAAKRAKTAGRKKKTAGRKTAGRPRKTATATAIPSSIAAFTAAIESMKSKIVDLTAQRDEHLEAAAAIEVEINSFVGQGFDFKAGKPAKAGKSTKTSTGNRRGRKPTGGSLADILVKAMTQGKTENLQSLVKLAKANGWKTDSEKPESMISQAVRDERFSRVGRGEYQLVANAKVSVAADATPAADAPPAPSVPGIPQTSSDEAVEPDKDSEWETAPEGQDGADVTAAVETAVGGDEETQD